MRCIAVRNDTYFAPSTHSEPHLTRTPRCPTHRSRHRSCPWLQYGSMGLQVFTSHCERKLAPRQPSCKVLNFLDAQPMQPNINNAQVSLHYQPHEAITTTTYNSTAVMPPFPYSVRPTSFRAEFLEIILQKNLAKVAPMIDHQARPSLLAQIPDHCSIHGKGH